VALTTNAGLNKLECLAGPSVPSFAAPYFLSRSHSAFFAACRAALQYAPSSKQPLTPLHLAVSICSKLAWIPRSAPLGTERRITASFDHLEKAISLAGDSGVSFELLI